MIYGFKSKHSSFGTKVYVNGKYVHVQFFNSIFNTSDKEIADALRNKPIYQGEKVVWEITSKQNKEVEKEVEKKVNDKIDIRINEDDNKLQLLKDKIYEKLIQLGIEKKYNNLIKIAKKEFRVHEVNIDLCEKILSLKDEEIMEMV
jgi:hypothetical protein